MPNKSELSALAHIRRESLDIYNRLHSIEADIAFVNEVRVAYPTYPLIPNLRCGAWYTDPAIAHPSVHAYFKSTDGHHGNWAFNLRRPNIHLLPIILAHGGLVLVDSTRAGKRIPDALSKTVPIWCAVINRATYLRSLDPSEAAASLHTPPGAVSAHEHAQIAARLDSWAAALADSSYGLPRLTRPLRPLWITPASTRFPHIAPDASFLPIMCVSASRAVHAGIERRSGGFSYVQGSGDDHEGLTPRLFWRHRTELLSCPREQVEAEVTKLASSAREVERTSASDGFRGAWGMRPAPILKVGGRVLIHTLADLPLDPEILASIPRQWELNSGDGETVYIVVYASDAGTPGEDSCIPQKHGSAARILLMRVPQGRRRRPVLVREVLPRAVSYASPHLSLGRKVCVVGGDEGVGVALVLLQLFFDDGGGPRSDTPGGLTDMKSSVRTRLEWIISSQPQVNPARAILKSVHDFLHSYCQEPT
ncbi:initiator tRNA phosphoribosyl transferase [Russula earlei]|uniref:Initiator tRNA phosphoribosyl transferase n=1 Tax=Russula earlei TaxID=71964 RepID=A0ACC0UIE6_9AGAM|nr:initiator tRNA phosphoribosyl transferase [Russula earlei]